MNLASIQFPAFVPYPKTAIELYLSGCNKRCHGCHNPDLQNFSFGVPLDTQKIFEYLKEREELFEIISFTGGDPLDLPNQKEFLDFCKFLKLQFPNKKFWLFTGEEKLLRLTEELVFLFDVIKFGPYIEELKQEGFPSSSNQYLWKKE